MNRDRSAASNHARGGWATATGAGEAVRMLRRLVPNPAGAKDPARAPGRAGDLELVCSTLATATIREGVDGRRHFVVHGPLSGLDGEALGTFRGVYQAKVFSQSDLVEHPEPPREPFDRPYAAGEPEWTPPLNPAKSEWVFDVVGHVIRGSGLGLSRIVLRPDGGTTFWFGVTSFITWHDAAPGALGQATSLATADFPTTPALLDGMSFRTEIVHTLSMTPTG